MEQLTTIWAAPSHQSITELHHVSSPPHDLDISAEATYVVEFASDRQRQADPTDRLVLVDILINKAGATSGGSHVRRVVWSRLFMSRDDMLSLLSASGVCRLATISCELQLNHRVWPSDDSVRRQILSGDYVQLTVEGPNDVPASHIQLALCEREAADNQRYVFGPSPTPSPEHTTPVAEAEDTEEEVTSCHSVSLLQHTASVQRGAAQVSIPNHVENDSLQKVGRDSSGPPRSPHVTDLWCGGQDALNESLPPFDGVGRRTLELYTCLFPADSSEYSGFEKQPLGDENLRPPLEDISNTFRGRHETSHIITNNTQDKDLVIDPVPHVYDRWCALGQTMQITAVRLFAIPGLSYLTTLSCQRDMTA